MSGVPGMKTIIGFFLIISGTVVIFIEICTISSILTSVSEHDGILYLIFYAALFVISVFIIWLGSRLTKK